MRVRDEVRSLVQDIDKEFKKPSVVLPKRCTSYTISGEESVVKVKVSSAFLGTTCKQTKTAAISALT